MAQLPTLPALTADVLRSVTIEASGAERTFTVDGGVWTEGSADVSAETASLADVLSQPAFSGCVDYHTGDDTIYQLPAEQAAPILALAPQA